jgi:hypothetical protein
MRTSSLSKFRSEEWLATRVTAAITWLQALAFHRTNRQSRVDATPSAGSTPPVDYGAIKGYLFSSHERFTHGYHGRCRW